MAGASDVILTPVERVQERYEFIEQVLRRFAYARHGKQAKGLLRAYLIRMTGDSRGQLTRLIPRHVGGARLGRRSTAKPDFLRQEVHYRRCVSARPYRQPAQHLVRTRNPGAARARLAT